MKGFLKTGLTLIIFFAALTSCSRKDYIKRGDTLPVAYKKAMTLYQKEKYSDAADAFDTVIQIGRGTEYGKEAQFYLAESYYNDKRYLLAASEYERFSTLFPRDKRREESDFKEAYCYYELSPRYKLDQKFTKKAVEKFRLFSSHYPNSDRIEKSGKYITELREKLAEKLYEGAKLYMRTDRYEAATIYYDLTIDKYPEASWAEHALVDEINTYVIYANHSIRSKQRERYEKAVESYEKYVQLFPQGEYRSKAEDYVDDAHVALANLKESSPEEEVSPDTVGATQ